MLLVLIILAGVMHAPPAVIGVLVVCAVLRRL